MKRIYDSLNRVFEQNRMIFWYDPEREWEQVFDGFDREATQKIKVEGTAFGTKVAIHNKTFYPNPTSLI